MTFALTVVTLFAVTAAIVAFLHAYYFSIIGYLFDEDVRADEIHWVETEDGWRVRLCRYRPKGTGGAPVFLCHGALGNQFNFTSPRGASIVDALVERGYDCWVIDFRGNRAVRPPAGKSRFSASLDDYLLKDAPAAVDYIRQETGYAQVHWLGHSLGGMLLYAYLQVFGKSKLATGVTLASPPGFHGVNIKSSPVLVAILKYSPLSAYWYLRGMSPLIALLGKLPQKVVENTPVLNWTRQYTPVNWRNMHPDTGPATFYNLLETMPYRAAGDLLGWARTNQWRMNDDRIDIIKGLPALDLPLFLIYGEADPFVPRENRETFFDVVASKDKRILVLSKENGHSDDYNHVDLAFAREGRTEVAFPIADWLDEHSPKRRAVATSTAVAEPQAEPRRATLAARKNPAAKRTAAAKSGPKTAARKAAPKKKASGRSGGVNKKPAVTKKPAAKKKPKKKAARRK